MPDVHPNQVRALADLFVGYLTKGSRDFYPPDLGPLAALVLTHSDESTRERPILTWLVGWPQHVRTALQRGLAVHLKAAVQSDRRKTAIELLWGISAYPLGASRVAARLGVAPEDVTDWVREALDDERLREELEASALRHGAERIAPAARLLADPPTDLHWHDGPEAWPHPHFQPAIRGAMKAAFQIESFSSVDAASDEERWRLTLHLLRRMAVRFVRSEYLRLPEHAALLRQFMHDVATPWGRQYVESFGTVGREQFVHNPARARLIGPLTSLAMFAVLPASPANRENFAGAVAEHNAAKHVLGLPGDAERRRLDPAEWIQERTFRVATPEEVATISEETKRARALGGRAKVRTKTFARAPFNGSIAFERSRELAETEGPRRLELAEEYVALRHGYRPGASGFREFNATRAAVIDSPHVRGRRDWADAVLLSLADQSVHLAILNLDEFRLLDELTTAIENTGHDYAYRELAYRDQGLRFSKQHDHASGIAWIMKAERQVADALEHPGEHHDPQSLLESAQQIALAAGGVCVRVVEEMLLIEDRRDAHPGITRYAAAALYWSWQAVRRLERLDRSLEAGLTAQRYSDHHLAWSGWRVLANLQLLRSQVTVRAAIVAGIVDESRLHPHDPSFACGLDVVSRQYRSIITMPLLEAANLDAVVINGLWLAMMTRVIPIETAPSPVLARTPFLTRPRGLDDNVTEVARLDLSVFSDWLRENPRMQPGILGHLPLDGPVARSLEELSGGLYREWRSGLVQGFDRWEHPPKNSRY